MTVCKVVYQQEVHDFWSLGAAQEFIDNLPSPRGDLEIVDAPELFRLLNEVGAPMTNWREVNQQICQEWSELFEGISSEDDLVRTEAHRVSLLQTFKAVMDIAETTIEKEDVEVFRSARDKQYKTFIFQESMVGENVCVETLFAVTQREIEAGRMSLDHSCRRIAEDGMAMEHCTRAELLKIKEDGELKHEKPKENLANRFKRWFTGE